MKSRIMILSRGEERTATWSVYCGSSKEQSLSVVPPKFALNNLASWNRAEQNSIPDLQNLFEKSWVFAVNEDWPCIRRAKVISFIKTFITKWNSAPNFDSGSSGSEFFLWATGRTLTGQDGLEPTLETSSSYWSEFSSVTAGREFELGSARRSARLHSFASLTWILCGFA